MTATERFIGALEQLDIGDLALLRTHAGRGLHEAVGGFDLFTGLWWPLREKTPRAPRREVAWLVAKLYALCPVAHSPGETLGKQLGRAARKEQGRVKRLAGEFDKMLSLPLDRIESALQQAILRIVLVDYQVDWVKLTDDLSRWESEAIRLRWAEEFLENIGGMKSC